MKRTKRVLGLALAAVMCMGMLAGCGGTKNATNGTETSEKVLNIATIGETTTLSPLYVHEQYYLAQCLAGGSSHWCRSVSTWNLVCPGLSDHYDFVPGHCWSDFGSN